MRVSALRDVTWNQVDLERGILRIDHNKNGEVSVTRMDPGVVEALQRWQELQLPEVRKAGYVVAHPVTGQRFPKSRAAEILRASLKKAGVTRPELFETTDARMQLRAHDLRATFVTISLAQGRSETWVTDRTGHKSSIVLYRYKRGARTHAEAELGGLTLLHEVIPELADSDE